MTRSRRQVHPQDHLRGVQGCRLVVGEGQRLGRSGWSGGSDRPDGTDGADRTGGSVELLAGRGGEVLARERAVPDVLGGDGAVLDVTTGELHGGVRRPAHRHEEREGGGHRGVGGGETGLHGRRVGLPPCREVAAVAAVRGQTTPGPWVTVAVATLIAVKLLVGGLGAVAQAGQGHGGRDRRREAQLVGDVEVGAHDWRGVGRRGVAGAPGDERAVDVGRGVGRRGVLTVDLGRHGVRAGLEGDAQQDLAGVGHRGRRVVVDGVRVRRSGRSRGARHALGPGRTGRPGRTRGTGGSHLAAQGLAGPRSEVLGLEGLVLDVLGGDRAVLDLLAGDGDGGVRRAAQRDDHRDGRGDGGVAAAGEQ